MHTIQAIILAGGKGTRMNQGVASPIPKALYPICGKPMIWYILNTLKNLKTPVEEQSSLRGDAEEHKNPGSRAELTTGQGIKTEKPIVVVGYKAQEVIKVLGSKYQYAIQKQRLGTGHAAKIGLEAIRVNQRLSKGSKSASIRVGDVFILQSDDSAFYKKETLLKAISEHSNNKATITFFTTRIPGLTDYGRIIRNENGDVVDVVEKENMTCEQAKIDETNCGAYLVNTQWLKDNIDKITRHYKGGTEYPLPDIIKIALAQNKKVLGIEIDPSEWVGINSPDQLERAEKLMQCRLPKKLNNWL